MRFLFLLSLSLLAFGCSKKEKSNVIRFSEVKRVESIKVESKPCAKDCASLGRCVPLNGQCVAFENVDCEKSELCKETGACTASKGQCVKVEDCTERCKQSGACKYSPQHGRCIAVNEEDCKKARSCVTRGSCSLSGVYCVPTTNKHCEESGGCKEQAFCTLELANSKPWISINTCSVKKAKDCKQSDLCKYLGECKFSQGECVK